MASSMYSGEDEYLIGSDSADEIYKPVVLKTFKHGINRLVTFIAFGNNEEFGGYFVLICDSNKQLAMFSYSGDFRKYVQLNSSSRGKIKYLIRDCSLYEGKQMIFSTYIVNVGSYFHLCIDPSEVRSYAGDSAAISVEHRKDTTNHIVTGICLLEELRTSTSFISKFFGRAKLRLAICYVDSLSYEMTPNSRRYVVEVRGLSSIFNSDAKVSDVSDFTLDICPDTLIEFKDENKKERYFTFPKRITVSNLGDKWIIDRRSPSSGDVKVFKKQYNAAPLLKFVYRGNPGSTFDPMDIKPSQDVMVISDCSNNNVHLVKNDGTFLMHLMTGSQGLQYPRALCVDDFDRIWVGCNDGTIHILDYRTEFEA